MNWLLVFIPVAVALEHLAPEQSLWIFGAAALAIIPLAGWLGRATEQIAERTGEGIGGLLNATFGNAAELIIGFAALRAGLYDVLKASIAGSIIGNILLVLGAAMLCGGFGRSEQHYNAAGARSQATMLTLAVIALILPAAYRLVAGDAQAPELGPLSVWISLVLIAVYAANLVFSLVTNRTLFAGSDVEGGHAVADEAWSIRRAALVLAGATAGIAWMSEILVGAIEPASARLGLNDMFVGVFVVAILGNAAEHTTAIVAAMKNRMDLALSIAIGSSVQIALFVVPLLVLLSYAFGPTPMDLAFSGGLVLTVTLAVWITGQVAGDGRSDWLRGVQLLAVYVILALVFLFAPGVRDAMTEYDAGTTSGLKWLIRAYASRRYAILFYSLLITMAAGPLFEALGVEAGLLEVLLAANLLTAVLPVGPSAVRRFLLCALLVVCSLRLGAAWLDYPVVTAISLAMWTVVAMIAAAGAIRFAMRARTVAGEHLYAALDAYLLFGTFLGVLYWTLDRAWPASLVTAGQQTEGLLSLSASIYFSFVTLVSLGYGDILPHSDAARGLAIVEAVTGQFYLAVMIAHLVSLHVRGETKRKDD